MYAIDMNIRVMVADSDEEIDENLLDDLANEIELGINAVEDNIKLKYPNFFEGFDWSMD